MYLPIFLLSFIAKLLARSPYSISPFHLILVSLNPIAIRFSLQLFLKIWIQPIVNFSSFILCDLSASFSTADHLFFDTLFFIWVPVHHTFKNISSYYSPCNRFFCWLCFFSLSSHCWNSIRLIPWFLSPFLLHSILSHGPKNHVDAHDYQIYISNPDLFSELHMYSSKCLSNISS